MRHNSVSSGAAKASHNISTSKTPEVFTIEEIKGLLKTSASMKKDLEAVIELYLLTGIHLSEAVNLQFDDTDFETKTITIPSIGKTVKRRLIPLGLRSIEPLNYFQQRYEKPVPFGREILQRSFSKVRQVSGINGSFDSLRKTAYLWYWQELIPSSFMEFAFGHSPR